MMILRRRMLMGSTVIAIGGRYQLVGATNSYLYRSTDYGATWAELTSVGQHDWYKICISASGQYQTAIAYGEYLYVSTDYGSTWTAKTTLGTQPWYGLSMSSTGQYQTALSNGGYMYASTDYGSTWTAKTTLGTKNWLSVSTSGNGQYLLAVVYDNYPYVSTDYGSTWTAKTALTMSLCNVCIVSSTGQYQIVITEEGWYATSSNYGSTWTISLASFTAENGVVNSLAGSADLQYMICNASGEACFISSNRGVSWSKITSLDFTTNLSAVVSNTGKYQMFSTYNGYVIKSVDFGATWTNITDLGSKYWLGLAMSEYTG